MAASTIANKPANRSRYIQFISGIQGISAGANATINMGMGRRYHRIKFQCGGYVNYTSETGNVLIPYRTTNKIVTPCTAGTLAVTSGAPTGIGTVASGGANWTTGDLAIIRNNSTGSGGIFTVTASSGAVTAATFAASVTYKGGTIYGPLDPQVFFTSVRLVVNGTTVRDVSPDTLQKIAVARGYIPLPGELAIDFTEPGRNMLQNNDVTAWDMVGQNTFEILLGINSTINSPNLTGSQEFDYLRNGYTDSKGNFVSINNQIKYREQTFAVGSGTTDLNALSYVGAIQRIWLKGSSPGNIYRLEVYQDGEKRLEATQEQILQMVTQYGFELGRYNPWNQFSSTNPTTATLSGSTNPLTYFDAAYLPDVDQRLSDALLVSSELIVRVYSGASQNVTVVMETAPGGYL